MKNNSPLFFIDTIYEKPVRLNMAFPFTLVFPMQFVAFFHCFAVFIERACNFIIKRYLQPQHFIQVFKGMMPFCGFFPPEHSVPFFKSRDGLCVKAQFPGFGVAMFGALRAIVGGFRHSKVRCINSRGKSNDHRPCRYFVGHFNGQPAAGRNFNSLCVTHKENIA